DDAVVVLVQEQPADPAPVAALVDGIFDIGNGGVFLAVLGGNRGIELGRQMVLDRVRPRLVTHRRHGRLAAQAVDQFLAISFELRVHRSVSISYWAGGGPNPRRRAGSFAGMLGGGGALSIIRIAIVLTTT